MNSPNNGNNRGDHTCFGKSRECVVCTTVLASSTFIYVASMALTVYLTQVANGGAAIVVLIVGSSILYILSFSGHMYNMYYNIPNREPSEDRESSNRSNETIGSSAQSNSTNAGGPDLVNIPNPRGFFRSTPPPPPYDVQLLEMSRILQPGTVHSSAREAAIVEEARRLILRLYEDINRADQLTPQSSTDEQPVQQMVQTPKTPMTQKKTMSPIVSPKTPIIQKRTISPIVSPKTEMTQKRTMSPIVSHQNLVVQKQQTIPKSSPGHGIPLANFRANQAIQQKVAQSSLSTQLDLGRLLIGSEGCGAINPQKLSRNHGGPPTDLGTNQVLQQKVTLNSPRKQPDLERFVIGSDGYVTTPSQVPPLSDGILKVAHRRKLKQQLQARPSVKGNVPRMVSIGNGSQSNEYELIEFVGSNQSVNSSQATYGSVESYCTESEFEDPSDKSLSVASSTSEPILEEQKKTLLTPSVKEPRQLSIQATRKFCQLGVSPQTMLNAVTACPELDGDEWMAAWNLSLKNVPPVERATILGLRLQEES